MLDEEWWKIWWWMEYEHGTRSNFGLYVNLIWIRLDLIRTGLDWIWYCWIWFDFILIGWGFDLIKTLWCCKQVNVGFELKSNVHDNAPMSKVEYIMESWIRRRLEWMKLERFIMDEDVNGLN